MDTNKATKEELLQTKEIIESAPNDRVGTLGEIATTGLTGLVGYGAAPSVASWFGASTILGSSSLGSYLGGFLATTTPVGWIIGTSVIAAISAFGISKLIKSGGKHTQIRKQNLKEIDNRIIELNKNLPANCGSNNLNILVELLEQAVSLELMPQEQANILLKGVKEQTISVEFALETTRELIHEQNTEATNLSNKNAGFDKQFEIRLTAFLLKKMMTIGDIVETTSTDVFYQYMNQNFDLSKDEAENIFLSIPNNIDISSAVNELAKTFDSKTLISVYSSLLKLAKTKPEQFQETSTLLKEIQDYVNNLDNANKDIVFTKHALNIENKQADIDSLIEKL